MYELKVSLQNLPRGSQSLWKCALTLVRKSMEKGGLFNPLHGPWIFRKGGVFWVKLHGFPKRGLFLATVYILDLKSTLQTAVLRVLAKIRGWTLHSAYPCFNKCNLKSQCFPKKGRIFEPNSPWCLAKRGIKSMKISMEKGGKISDAN